MTEHPLGAREVYQLLRDIALGVRTLRRSGAIGWRDMGSGELNFAVDDWQISLYNDGNGLDYCAQCISADGRRYRFDASQRFGTDPVELLSTWELAQLQRLLNEA